MEKFMLAYHGGRKPNTPEEGKVHMENWKKWVASLGDKVVNPGTPLPESCVVTSESVSSAADPNAMNGFAVIQANSMDEAIAIAKEDPFLKMDGKIRVSRMMQM